MIDKTFRRQNILSTLSKLQLEIIRSILAVKIIIEIRKQDLGHFKSLDVYSFIASDDSLNRDNHLSSLPLPETRGLVKI